MSSKTACKNCGGTDIDRDPARGHAVCTGCGSVLEDTLIVSEVQFAENSGGGSSVVGQFISAEGGGSGTSMTMGTGFHPGMGKESRALTLQKGKRKINELAALLQLNTHCSETAYNFFKMAVQRRVTRGRKSAHVIAACLYLVCRTEGTPHMLLDFSDALQINVYTLGKTYLALARLLSINVPAIDPSLLIPRFAHKLEYGDKTHEVSMTAIRFVSRMKRDWMAVGRRPSGLCGAALLVASRIHNFCRTKKDIIKVVKVCESTLRKRLTEFEDTESGKLTIEEFKNVDLEVEADPPSFTQSRKEAKMKQMDEMLTKEMTEEIGEVTSEIERELETRSSKRVANMEREAFGPLKPDEVLGDADLEDPNAASFIETEIINESLKPTTSTQPMHHQTSVGPRPTAASLGLTVGPVHVQDVEANDGEVTEELDLEGLDDAELESFILTDEEMKTKERVWMALNGEFLKEQTEKLKRKAEEEAAKPPKVRRKRRKININASTAGEAMEKMLHEKKLSNKIDYEVLKNLTNGGTSDLVNKMSGSGGSTSAADSSIDLSADSSNNSSYLPDVIDETPSTSQPTAPKRSSRAKQAPSTAKTKTSSPQPTLGSSEPETTLPLIQPESVIETEPIVETAPIQDEEEYLDEEQYEDEDEPVSAAQLLGHGVAGDEEDYDYD